MGSLHVAVHDDVMSISKSPGIQSLGIFAGIISLGVGAAYYGSDHITVKCIYILGCFFLAGSILEDWEECILDKTQKKITVRRSSFFQSCFKLKKSKELQVRLSHVIAVNVEAICVEHPTPRYNIALILRTGMPLLIVESSITQNRSDCNLVVERIERFLKLNHLESVDDLELDDSHYYSDRESSSSDSDVREMASIGLPRETVTQVNNANR